MLKDGRGQLHNATLFPISYFSDFIIMCRQIGNKSENPRQIFAAGTKTEQMARFAANSIWYTLKLEEDRIQKQQVEDKC